MLSVQGTFLEVFAPEMAPKRVKGTNDADAERDV